jgi:hypothetical protein
VPRAAAERRPLGEVLVFEDGGMSGCR